MRNSPWGARSRSLENRCLKVHLKLLLVLSSSVISNLHHPKPTIKIGYIDKTNNNNRSLHSITHSLHTYLLSSYCMGYNTRDVGVNQTDQVSVFMGSIYNFPVTLNASEKRKQSKGEGKPRVELI